MNQENSKFAFASGSASDIFNEMAARAIRKQDKVPTILVASPEEQALVQDWLAKPETRAFLETANAKDRKSLGIVEKVTDEGDGVMYVQYLDQSGETMGFMFSQGKEEFAATPIGFAVGDIILNEFEENLVMKSVKTVNFSPRTEEKIIRRFKSIWANK